MKRFPTLALLLLLMAARLAAQEVSAPVHDEREYEIGKRMRHEYLEQLRAHGITAASMRDAWMASREREGKRALPATQSTTWEFLGPRNQAGRIKALAVSSADDRLWFCGADGGGIWRSTNAGDTWTPLIDTLPSLRIGALALSPHNDRLLLGGTFEGMIYRSNDGGDRWSVIALPEGGFVRDIRFHPENDGVVLAAAQGGLFESTDNGVTWRNIKPGGRLYSVVYNLLNPEIIFFGQNDEGGNGNIWRSTDGGATWKSVLRRPAGYWGTVTVRLCAAQPNVLYASFADANTFYKSIDGGDNWSKLPSQPYRDGYSRGFDFFEVSPLDPDVVFAGTTHLFRTMDGGVTWSAGDTVNKNLHVDHHSFLFPSNMMGALIIGNDGGVYITENYIDGQLEWRTRNRDLVTLEIYNCAIHPKADDTIIVGCQDNGYDKYSGDEYNWLVVGGDGFCTLYDRDHPNYFYHEYIYQNLHRADDGFTWWSRKKMNGLPTDTTDAGFYTGITGPDRVDWYGQGVTMSPADPKTLYMGTNFLYKTTDRAESWRKISDDEYSSEANDCITGIAVAPSKPSQLYVGTLRGKVFRVHDEAGSVQSVDITPSFRTGGRVRGIAISATNPDRLYIAGDGGYDLKGVMMSTDGGATWSVRSNGLPRAGVNRIVADPDSAATLYCGTTLGLYYTRDGGAHWLPMPGFPNVEVWDIAFDARTRTILAGTYGRGAIRARRFVPPAYEPPASVTANDAGETFSLDVIDGRDDATLRLHLPEARDLTITLYDYLGRAVTQIHSGYLAAGIHQFALGAAHSLALPTGVYFIEARGEGVAVQRKWRSVRK